MCEDLRQERPCPFGLGLVEKAGGRRVLDDFARVQKHDAIGNFPSEANLVAYCNNHSGRSMRKSNPDIQNFVDPLRVERGGRFIERHRKSGSIARARAMANRHKQKKAILTPEHIAKLIVAAREDAEHGIYYAFPFLAGTRPSEQLGLLWSEVDFDRNVIRIRRIQERDGSLTEVTKTDAGTRDIPMSAVLREMLLTWRVRCPRKGKELHRVFPGPGRLQEWPKPRIGGGGPLLYQNFRKRYWAPIFKALKLPYVTPHSARHSFISTLQAQGIEVGLVAQIAGHANPTVTLGHYTQAVRDGSAAIEALDRVYGS